MHAEKTRITRCDNNRGLSRVRQAGWPRAARRGRPTASDIVRIPRENAPGGAAGMAGLPGVRLRAAPPGSIVGLPAATESGADGVFHGGKSRPQF